MVLTYQNVVIIKKIKLYDGSITKKELSETLKSMYNNKSPENHGLPKELYETFWDSLEEPLLILIRTSFLKQE